MEKIMEKLQVAYNKKVLAVLRIFLTVLTLKHLKILHMDISMLPWGIQKKC